MPVDGPVNEVPVQVSLSQPVKRDRPSFLQFSEMHRAPLLARQIKRGVQEKEKLGKFFLKKIADIHSCILVFRYVWDTWDISCLSNARGSAEAKVIKDDQVKASEKTCGEFVIAFVRVDATH